MMNNNDNLKMNRGRSSHVPEFKGIYYNESKEQQYFEGGAHFSYLDLYQILEKLKQTYPYNLNEKVMVITKSKNAFISNANSDAVKIEPKTRNPQPKMEKANTKHQLTAYTQKVNQNFFQQYIQPKNMGVSIYINNNNDKTPLSKPKNKVIVPKPNKIINQPRTKSITAKRNVSEDPHGNTININKLQPQSSRMPSNTQKVIEYSDRVKQKNMNSARVNLTRNGNNNHKHSINNNTDINNATSQTFAFSNSSTKQVKSRNSNRMTGNDFFDNHSFYTKSECRRKDKKEVISVRHTMDKEGKFNKTSVRKVCSSISRSTRGKNGNEDKSSNNGVTDKNNAPKMNGSIELHKAKLKKSFLSS